MQISVRVSYPEDARYDWSIALKEYEEIGSVEVAFYLPEPFLKNVSLERVVEPFKEIKLRVPSVHMAHARITEPYIFERVLKKTIEIAKSLDCNLIVAHPSYGSLNQCRDFIDGIVDPLLNEHKIFLCWETFSSKKRFLSGIKGIVDFCRNREWYKACYDFSHLHYEEEKVFEDIENYLDYIKIFHVSNRVKEKKLQHLPIFSEEAEHNLDLDFHKILDYLNQKEFSGSITLEYLPQFHDYLRPDARFLMAKYKKKIPKSCPENGQGSGQEIRHLGRNL